MTSFAFYVVGTPASQGSKRHVGHGVMIESSKKVQPWRQAVIAAAPPIPAPLDGPLALRLIFTLPRPKSARKTDVAPYRGIDIDKAARATFDAITIAGLWADDARVCDVQRLAKVWTGFDEEALPVPGAVIACSTIDDIRELWRLCRACVADATRRIRGDT